MIYERSHQLSFASAMLVASLLLIGQPALSQPVESFPPFSAEWLQDHARELARRPFQPRELSADNPLRQLDYDDYRRIVFDPEAAIWRNQDSAFQLQLFHPGFLATAPVELNLINDTETKALPFTPDVFNYHPDIAAINPEDADGYAGFRVHYPINSTPGNSNPGNSNSRIEEFLVFLGASYFRGVAEGQFYGLSARGLAVNTVGPGSEEFPRFSEFWIETPAADASEIIIHALLDSPSLTGAYRFQVKPGANTVMDVEASLFLRRDLQRVGIAPLTSMFLFDATNRSAFDDFRRAVHDSDGLLIQQANGETLWRPLANPENLQVSSFGKERPLGFGLLQRHQSFDQFQDAEARYDKRPSLWIEPQGDWGTGEVVLVEIPSDEETNDNIVAYWQPTAGLDKETEYHYAYRMIWGDGPASELPPGRVVETAIGAPAFGTGATGEREFVIDFSDGASIFGVDSAPDSHTDPVRINTFSSAGNITNVSGSLVQASGNYRVYVKLDPQEADLVELRVALEVDDQQWGETWLYRWSR